jgi:hypothetical protein
MILDAAYLRLLKRILQTNGQWFVDSDIFFEKHRLDECKNELNDLLNDGLIAIHRRPVDPPFSRPIMPEPKVDYGCLSTSAQRFHEHEDHFELTPKGSEYLTRH